MHYMMYGGGTAIVHACSARFRIQCPMAVGLVQSDLEFAVGSGVG